ncbi:MAG: hypothetical protein L6243_04090 [Candidatus Altiarchaeales archaeon]|nr:ribonuclease P protein component 2 [Candidatus Altiarchaeota archaeon]MBU4341745.1 ribonuclease P protein component 2 [Candidatus Altiarchaeota archaeon]MBU4437589.1 ribonuclease P protein component 2 [Candidatus Altiarchaeota archaeon]MCG2782750.1 hypothetical protein [Candidatus Altiarchaeales archaeon]
MLKPIPPTQRERNRYLAFEAISDSPLKRDEIIRAIQNSCLNFLGELGTSKTGLWLMDWDAKTKKGILKVTHKTVDEVRASMALVKEINRQSCIIRVLGVSGTVKKAREKFIS